MTEQANRVPDLPAAHRPTKAEMEEAVTIDGTPDEIAAAEPRCGAPPRESAEPEASV